MNNKIIVFTGPSGVGKATIEKELFKNKSLKLSLSVSATTREPRKGERDGVHYYFVSNKKFDNLIENKEFIEWNAHFSNRYGTLKSELSRILKKTYNPFLEVEVNGAKRIIDMFNKKEIISIFIAPPSLASIEQRIRARGQENEQQISERVARVKEELQWQDLFDYRVINDALEHCVDQVTKIITRELK